MNFSRIAKFFRRSATNEEHKMGHGARNSISHLLEDAHGGQLRARVWIWITLRIRVL